MKERTIKLFYQLHLANVALGARKGRNITLEVSFAEKSHKPRVSLRTIVSERATWSNAVMRYMQKHLESLHILDPMCVSNSKVVSDFLKVSNPAGCSVYSIDVKELCYCIPHDDRKVRVKERKMEQKDESNFRTQCGITVEDFLEPLFVYLKPTLIGWQGKMFVQRSGACVGSRVASGVSKIF